MDVTVALNGVNAAQDAATLLDWLRQARLREVDRVEQGRRPPAPGEQGPELLPFLTVVLAGPAVVELVRCIHTWIQATRPSATVTVKTGARTVTIEAKNHNSLADLVEQARRLADG